jgi:hypothetical protein
VSNKMYVVEYLHTRKWRPSLAFTSFSEAKMFAQGELEERGAPPFRVRRYVPDDSQPVPIEVKKR